VDDWPHRHELGDGVDVLVLQAQLAHERELAVDELRTEMAQVEVHYRAVWRFDDPALLRLVDKGLGEPVTRAELHAAQHWRRARRAEVVVLQVAVAVLVEQPAPLGSRGLRDEDAGERQPGRVVLDKLHVLQRCAGSPGQGHAVPGVDVRVGGEGKDPSASAVRQDNGLRGDRVDAARGQLDGDDSLRAAVVDEQPGDERLVEAGDGVVLQRGLEERVQHVEAGLVGGEPRPHLLHPAECADRDVAVGLAAPRAAPVLKPQQLARRLLDERLDRVLVSQPVAARDGVVGMLVERVAARDDPGCAALGGHRVAPHRVDLGDDGDSQGRVSLGDGDGRAEAGGPTPDDQHVEGGRHRGSLAAELFMDQDAAAVMHHPPGDAPVVELVAVGLAAAGVVHVLDAQPVVVIVAVAHAVHYPPAGCTHAGQTGRGGHIVHLLRDLAATRMPPSRADGKDFRIHDQGLRENHPLGTAATADPDRLVAPAAGGNPPLAEL
jgi:hypothetical protein